MSVHNTKITEYTGAGINSLTAALHLKAKLTLWNCTAICEDARD